MCIRDSNDTVVEGLAAFTSNPRFAYDSYRRFIQMFSDVVMELSKKRFEEIIDAKKAEKGDVYKRQPQGRVRAQVEVGEGPGRADAVPIPKDKSLQNITPHFVHPNTSAPTIQAGENKVK